VGGARSAGERACISGRFTRLRSPPPASTRPAASS